MSDPLRAFIRTRLAHCPGSWRGHLGAMLGKLDELDRMHDRIEAVLKLEAMDDGDLAEYVNDVDGPDIGDLLRADHVFKALTGQTLPLAIPATPPSAEPVTPIPSKDALEEYVSEREKREMSRQDLEALKREPEPPQPAGHGLKAELRRLGLDASIDEKVDELEEGLEGREGT